MFLIKELRNCELYKEYYFQSAINLYYDSSFRTIFEMSISDLSVI